MNSFLREDLLNDRTLTGSIHFCQKHQAIGNRGYTNKVRLRGLSQNPRRRV
ncbi:hypothetical protein [Nostoc sp. PCC 7107]|uniref:hypothetical protein n=1 Tax=Nostoc sp. PCC 7107 TaxID=317936 RepID=UPI0002D2B50E|nr:hypothetical protein [Nostoc sp. PCC 7107]